MVIVRVLTDAGVNLFHDYLLRGATGDPRLADLEAPGMSEPFEPTVEVDTRSFQNRLDLGQYLLKQFKAAGVEPAAIRHNTRLWTWLSVFYFDLLCPKTTDGTRNLRQPYTYILSRDRYHYYRHLVATPFELVRLHGDAARALLAPPVFRHGDFVEQLASRQEIISNQGLIQAVDRLYFDPTSNRPKPGATDRHRPGTLRRLVRVAQQLAVTYDLPAMGTDEIISLLPAEFDSWKDSSPATTSRGAPGTPSRTSRGKASVVKAASSRKKKRRR